MHKKRGQIQAIQNENRAKQIKSCITTNSSLLPAKHAGKRIDLIAIRNSQSSESNLIQTSYPLLRELKKKKKPPILSSSYLL